jgi:hypothetical protein
MPTHTAELTRFPTGIPAMIAPNSNRARFLAMAAVLVFAVASAAAKPIGDQARKLSLQRNVPLSALFVKDEKPAKPQDARTVSPADAAKKVNEKVTVEFAVQSTGGRGDRLFLNSEKNYRDAKNFTIMIDMTKAANKFNEKKIEDPLKLYGEKTIRVTGTVTEYMGRAEIIVTDPDQIKIVEKK